MESHKNLLVLDFSVPVVNKELTQLLTKIKTKLLAVNVIVLLPPQKSENQEEILKCTSQILEILGNPADMSTYRDALTVGCLLTASAFKGRQACVITSRSNFAPPHSLVKIYSFLEAELMKFQKLPSPALSEEEITKGQEEGKLKSQDKPASEQEGAAIDRQILQVSYRFRSHLKRLFHMLAKALIQNVPRNVSSLINLCSTLCQGYVVREEKKNKEKLNLDQLTFEFVLRLFLDKIFLNKFVLEGIEKKRFNCIKDFLELDQIQQSEQTRQFIETRKEELNAKISQGEQDTEAKNLDSDDLVSGSPHKFSFNNPQQFNQSDIGENVKAPPKVKKETSVKGESVENFIYAIGSKIIELFKKMGLSQIKKLPKLRNSIANVVKNEAVKLGNSFLSENVEPVTDGVLDIFKAQGYIKVGGPGGLEYKTEYFQQMRPLSRQTATPTVAPPPIAPQIQLGHSFYPPHQFHSRGDFMSHRGGGFVGPPFSRGHPKHYPGTFHHPSYGQGKYNPYPNYPGIYGQKVQFQNFVRSKLTSSKMSLKQLQTMIDESFRYCNPEVTDQGLIRDEVFKVLAKFRQDELFYFEQNPKLNPSLKDWYKIKPETWSQAIVIRNS